jgi:hypothetical protein
MAQASSTFKVFEARISATTGSQSSDFGQLQGRFTKIYMLFLPLDRWEVDFRLPFLAKIAVGLLTLRKWQPFENYLPVTSISNALIFDHTYLGFPSIKSNNFFTNWADQ